MIFLLSLLLVFLTALFNTLSYFNSNGLCHWWRHSIANLQNIKLQITEYQFTPSSDLSMFIQNVTNKAVGIGESLRSCTFSNTNNTMLLRMKNTSLRMVELINQQFTARYSYNIHPWGSAIPMQYYSASLKDDTTYIDRRKLR